MTQLYAIVVDYHMYSKSEGDFDTPLFLGVDNHIFIFEDNLSNKTKTFKTKKEAEDYIKEHNIEESSSHCNPRVTGIVQRS